MKKSELKLLVIEIITILGLLLNIFVKNILNEYLMSLMFSILITIIVISMGYEKEKNVYIRNLIFFIAFYTVSFIILLYGLGLLTGYVRSPYSYDFINIIKTIFPLILVIILSEIFRYSLCKKGEKRTLIIILSIVLFTLADISMSLYFYDLKDISDLLELFTLVLLPSLFKNITLTDFAYRYGMSQNIIYRLITELYIYILPITPNLNVYLESVVMIIFPTILRYLIHSRFEKEEKEDFRGKHPIKKIITIVLILIIACMVGLYSNLFPLWIAVVGSGSMSPTIEIGDLVIIDKTYQDHLDKLKVGDVLVFKVKEKIYTHRIIDIEKENSNYNIFTKGDRKGNAKDNWIVENDDVIGVVKLKIKYLGYPSVWLNRMLEDR